jgi:hypothetical protein
MTVDRNFKQKRKREEVRKKIAQERERISQRENSPFGMAAVSCLRQEAAAKATTLSSVMC